MAKRSFKGLRVPKISLRLREGPPVSGSIWDSEAPTLTRISIQGRSCLSQLQLHALQNTICSVLGFRASYAVRPKFYANAAANNFEMTADAASDNNKCFLNPEN